MKVRIILTEPILGTRAGNKDLATEYQASKHPDGVPAHDELTTIEEQIEKASTIFDRDEKGHPFRWDYQFKGFLKEACLAMIETGTITKEELGKLKLTNYSYKRTIDKMIFVFPRKIILHSPSEPLICERRLRSQTMKGERIALAISEELPAGTYCDIAIVCLNKKHEPFIKQWLDYGALFGLGQWRSSGKGRFSWKELKEG